MAIVGAIGGIAVTYFALDAIINGGIESYVFDLQRIFFILQNVIGNIRWTWGSLLLVTVWWPFMAIHIAMEGLTIYAKHLIFNSF